MSNKRIELPMKKIIDMRCKSCSYSTIARELAKIGINVSANTLSRRFRQDDERMIDEDIEHRIGQEDERIMEEDLKFERD